MDERERTGVFQLGQQTARDVQDILSYVYRKLEERGYDPVEQIVGYLLSGDPTYITSHGDARKAIRQVDRLLLLEELVRAYVESRLRAPTS
ncbi:MAG: IreB family regulatory phosphoprotein [Armatimonadota bacterium]|nr:IreB family regulatory phosphoprotein [Armatimonadota bacterium]MDR7422967.1 IreB family regulatory phosphoprotein [Armatimonadota bacterium]MDR7454004.1 IreB family regulatory phosphoprotein [Armatimonadota bacterium]MDR7456877.1 IreB family regulatory phosphoprotein [Armatimonadota bacterium]MDR7495608.1 IreB family regulatory phosphoprotein [Armatimonadota bacterium]